MQDWIKNNRMLAAAAALLLAFGGYAVGAGLRGGEYDRPDSTPVVWQDIETNLLSLEYARLPLGNIDGPAAGGAIERLGDHLIYASANGHLATLDLKQGRIAYSEARVPMDYDRLQRDVFSGLEQFKRNRFRVNDILLRPTGSNTGELYVSHHLYVEDKEDMCAVITKGEIEITEAGLELVDGAWEEVYRVDYCLHLPDLGGRFDGHMSGGRMVAFDEDHLLFTVGDFGLSDFHDMEELAQADSDVDLGKIIKIDLTDGTSEPYAYGIRNGSGLAWDAAGRLWEVETASNGGDEVNLIKPGADYGWPNVTLGTAYGSPRKNIPLSPALGSHSGFAAPAMAFVPAIGVADIISVDANAGFEVWEGDLLVATTHVRNLYRLRPDGERIVYAEPILLDQRLRDVVKLNGAYAFLTGDLELLLLRPKNTAGDGAAIPDAITGYAAVGDFEAAYWATIE